MAAAALAAVACTVGAPGGPAPAPTADDAKKFLDGANETLLKLSVAGSQAGWVAQNFITDDTEALDARGDAGSSPTPARSSRRTSTRFDKVQLPADQRRQLDLLKVVARARDAGRCQRGRRSHAARCRACGRAYGKGKWCPDPAKPDSATTSTR